MTDVASADENILKESLQKKRIITLAGKPGSGKSTTAKLVAERLGFEHFSGGDLFRQIGEELGIDLLNANLTAETKNLEIDKKVDGRLREIGESKDQQVIDARMAWHWMPQSYKVYLDLDLKVAAQRIIASRDKERLENEHIPENPKDYAEILQRRLESEARRYSNKYNVNPFDVRNYDLVIDSAANGIDEVVGLVVTGFQAWCRS